MRIYMAPMEGITGYIYRTTYDRYFSGVDKYFTPFIVPAIGRPLRGRELKDILPENNNGMNVIPQLLTNDSEAFLKTARFLKGYGYDEVNLNLGCPSGTVVSKNRGSGQLYDTDKLDRFLYEIFAAGVVKISIKTRVGKDSHSEWQDILDIYNKYPITELIVHPRIQKEYYKGRAAVEDYLYAQENYPGKLCYNGDINSVEDYQRLADTLGTQIVDDHTDDRSNTVDINNVVNKASNDKELVVMLGRGLIADPYLPRRLKKAEELREDKGFSPEGALKAENISTSGKVVKDVKILKGFHDELYDRYCSELGAGNTSFKMKELWAYMGKLFDEGDSSRKALKKIMKARNENEYRVAVNALFDIKEKHAGI